MEEIQLYNTAVNSIKRYKESGEELDDFDNFIDEIEKEYSTRTYKVILTPYDYGYLVTVPDFDCNTQGKTIKESLFMAMDVIKTLATTLQEMGKEIPEPDSVKFKKKRNDLTFYMDVDI